MALVRWTHAREMISPQDRMDRMIEQAFGPGWATFRSGEVTARMPMDVYQTDREYVVKATLPGVKAEDVEVSVVGQNLTLKAKTQEEEDVKEESWLLKESRFSSFCRSIDLPTEVQSDKVDATMDGGILTIKLPKAEAAVPRTIQVKKVAGQ